MFKIPDENDELKRIAELAMIGLLASPRIWRNSADLVRWAYDAADEMMAEDKRRRETENENS